MGHSNIPNSTTNVLDDASANLEVEQPLRALEVEVSAKQSTTIKQNIIKQNAKKMSKISNTSL